MSAYQHTARKPNGYGITVGPPGTEAEHDTVLCCHCQRVIHVPAPVGWCTQCFKPQCPACEAKGVCTPFERVLETWENRRRMRCEGII